VIKSLSLLTRKRGMTHEQFARHWVEIHAPLAHAIPGLRRYVQSHIAELCYDDREHMARALASPEAKALHAAGALFIGRSTTFTVEERVIIADRE
jgi:uncharacterized protein (TIGR02118 family)